MLYMSVRCAFTCISLLVSINFQIFHKNDYSDEFIDANNYKQNKQNDECANTETKNELTTVSLPYIRAMD